MITLLQCDGVPLSQDEVEGLWKETISLREFADEQVNIKCVSEKKIRTLNKKYRGKDKSTNVLTFSYPQERIGAPRLPAEASAKAGSLQKAIDQRLNGGEVGSEHDVALCLEVAEREASERGAELKDYVARLIVHAFLHATGMDHEQSEEARSMAKLERKVLDKCGY